MKKLDEKVMADLIRIKNELPAAMEWLEASLETYTMECTTQRDEVLLRQAQGKAQLLSDVLGDIAKSPEYLKKLRSRKPAHRERL